MTTTRSSAPLASSALEENDLSLNPFGNIHLGPNAINAHVGLVRLDWGRAHAAQAGQCRKRQPTRTSGGKDIYLALCLARSDYPWLVIAKVTTKGVPKIPLVS